MARIITATILVSVTSLGVLYLWWINRGIKAVPAELKGILRKPWTKEEIHAAYQKVQESPTDIRPFLPGKKDRRYIVTGGSGQIGSWIVQHLLLRGENPAAIRILDLTTPTRPEVAQNGVAFFATDVGDETAVSAAFQAPWPAKVANLPLTVFHTVAYMMPHERKEEFMYIYRRVNINGTLHVLNAARSAGASRFISTSSGGAAIRPVNFFFPPWKSAPDNQVQSLADVKVRDPEGTLGDYGSCYTYSKVVSENIVRKADDKKAGFRTGVIRPGHILYGNESDSPSSAVSAYLDRGGTPNWLHNVAVNFGNAQNISIAHLAFENTLLDDPDSKLGGRIYHCADSGPPILFRELCHLLEVLAHPTRPCQFQNIPVAPILLMAYAIEAYSLLRVRYLTFLPAIASDMRMVQPALFQLSTIHTVYDNSAAERDIGYRAPIETLEGLCHHVLYFNQKLEAEARKEPSEGEGGKIGSRAPRSMLSAPVNN